MVLISCQRIDSQLILTSEALVLWITTPALWTIAQGTVVGHAALGISSARIALCAWILTTLVDAGLVTGTLRVAAAFHGGDRFLVTVDKWISDHVVGTAANCSVVLGHTFGITGTRISDGTRVLTNSVAADLRS